MPSRSLLLPIETLNREFDGKLLLALHAAERGWNTTFGKRSTLHDNVQRFPDAIYFSKDFRSGNQAMFGILTDLGHVIVGLDEEGLVDFFDEFRLMKLDPEVIDDLSVAFTWGENDARIYRLAPGMADKPIVAAGNPRVDMLRPELALYFAGEVARIRERYRRFVLFNTNFSMVNHFISNHTRFRVADWVSEDKAAEMKSGLLRHKARLLDAFLKLIPDLARALHPYPLVIRPHPSEDRRTWDEAAEGLENVHVVHEGSVVAWLTAADVLIHNGCTSAVEAAVLGTPALAYRPVKQPGWDLDLPNGLSLKFEAGEELVATAVEMVRQHREGRYRLDPERQAFLEHHLAALTGPLACERLMDEIERCRTAYEPALDPFRYRAARARHAVRRTWRRIRKRSATAKGNPVYLSHKFPGIGLAEVNERIGRLTGATGRFEGYRAEEIMPDLFRMVGGPA